MKKLTNSINSNSFSYFQTPATQPAVQNLPAVSEINKNTQVHPAIEPTAKSNITEDKIKKH